MSKTPLKKIIKSKIKTISTLEETHYVGFGKNQKQSARGG